MSKKKVSYQNLLKQAIAEYDTSTHLQVKGPMLDPIIGWDGDGELPTYKDAASILERYYFNQDADKGVEVLEADMENDKGEDGKGMEHGEGAGTEQAGTDDATTIEKSLDSKEKMIAKEQEGEEAEEEGEEEEEKEEEKEEEVEESEVVSEEEWDDKDVPPAKKYDKENMTTEDIENAVIEKLIAEMEEEEAEEKEEEGEEKEEEMEEAEVMTYKGEGPKEEAPKEKVSKDPEEHTTGAGTEQAGTGDAEGEVPDRKDVADDMVKPNKLTSDNVTTREQDEEAAGGGEEAEEKEEGGEEEELDVDKKMEEAVPLKVVAQKQKDFDYDNDAVSEAFELFKEQIEDDE